MSGSDISIRLWEYEAIDLYGKCLAAHNDCRAWHANSTGKVP